jgi:hypothetical protein
MTADDFLTYYNIPHLTIEQYTPFEWKLKNGKYRIRIIKRYSKLHIQVYDIYNRKHIIHRYRLKNAAPILQFLKLI